jgi:nicotinamidase-related amidase
VEEQEVRIMKHERIFLDIETQNDFFSPDGTLYSDEADAAAEHICELFDWAASTGVPVMSTVLRTRRYERGPYGLVPHCVEDTDGERKLPGTVLPRRVNLGLLNTTDLPRNIFDTHQQVIFEKREPDIFAHARAERLLTELSSATFIVCGAGVSKGIALSAVGLRTRGFGVIVASDAVLHLRDPLTEMAVRRMEAKGVIFAPTEELIAPKRVRGAKPFRRSAVHARK